MPDHTNRPDEHVLAAVIDTVASSLDLGQVLAGVVRLLSDASGVHACFVYLVEDGGERLVLQAASPPFGDRVGQIVLERGEGLAWWSLEQRTPAFIRDDALADPRFKYVPELAEERFQSLVAVPVVSRGGEAIGTIMLHSEAPREFTRSEVDTLAASASLVAGAIENARLFEETRRRVHQLELLNALGATIAQAETVDELLPAITTAWVELLDATSCAAYVLEPAREELQLAAVSPSGAPHPVRIALGDLGPALERGRRARSDRLVVPLLVGADLRGLIEIRREGGRFAEDDSELARTAASQTAIALERIELIERLTEKNAIKDFFDDLAAGRLLELATRAAELGVELGSPQLVLAATHERVDEPPAGWATTVESALRREVPGSLFDLRDGVLRALLPLRTRAEAALVERVRLTLGVAPPAVVAGISGVCRGAASFSAGFAEAHDALLATAVVGGARTLAHRELGAYRYLLRMALEDGDRDPRRTAVETLAEYDRRRSTSLVRTLEEYLRNRGSIAATSTALFVHQNTLRQRLQRIGELTGIDFASEDRLALEIAVKLGALERALERHPHLRSLTRR